MQSPSLRRTYAVLSLLILALAFFLALRPASAAPLNTDKTVVLVVLNQITANDLFAKERVNMAALADNGAAGLMNARAASGAQTGSFYLSIGAGARGNAGNFGKMGFNENERLPDQYFAGLLTAREVWFQNSGTRPKKDSVINLGAYVAANHSARYRRTIVAGLLGESLKQAGLKTAVIGNADSLGQIRREITLITMDFSGETSYGDVSNNLTRLDKTAPGGLVTDQEKLVRLTKEMASKAAFTAVEFGDTSRVNNQRTLMRKTVFEQEHEKALQSADLFIGQLIRELPMDRTLLIITSPQLMKDPERGRDTLVPIIISGAGQGALVSDTTRRDGIVANMDIAPTILNFLDVPIPVEMAGSVIKASPTPSGNILGFLTKRYSEIYALRQLRTPFLVSYSVLRLLGLALALIALVVIRRGRPLSPVATGTIQVFLLLLLSIPLAAFLQLPLNETNTLASLGSLFSLAALVAVATFLSLKQRPLIPLILIAGATALTIALDTATGAALANRSFFGSDIISGGRFYGVGNTLMGVLTATTVFASAGLIEISGGKKKYGAWLGTAAILIVAFIVGHPRLGANVGGLITVTATALVFLFYASHAKLRARTLLGGLTAFVLFVPAVLRLDLFSSESTSHAGKAMAVIEEQGGSAVLDIILRKLDMNIRGSFSYNMGLALVMILALFVIIKVLDIKRDHWLEWLGGRFGDLSRGFMVLIWAAVLAYAVNDTGSVAAQLVLTYLTIPLLYLLLDSERTGKSAPRREKATTGSS